MPIFGGASPGWFSFDTPIYSAIGLIGLSFLALYFFGFVSPRAWCKICPSGGLLSLFNKGSLMKKEKDVQKCTKCGICKRVCPMQIKEIYEEKEKKSVDSTKCIRCFSCTDHCPEEDCLKVKIFGKTLFRSGGSLKTKIDKPKKKILKRK